MLCALFAFTSCEQNEMNVSRVIGDGFTLVGNSTLQTKTAFGTPGSESIPFLWSEGDCIMVNNNWSESLQEGGPTAQFEFISGSVQPGDGVYYGCVEVDNSGKAMVATLPWQDGDCNDVGYNAEFGYAVVDSDNSFTLQHYTSYLWLNSWSSANLPKVSNIKITAENDIVGWCEFDETSREFVGDVTPFKNSKILFVDDGSKDETWKIIRCAHNENDYVEGLKLSKNVGHQNALLAGLFTAKDICDVTVSIDADLQDDISVIEEMIDKYTDGAQLVLGVRNDRKTDTLFKRFTAQTFYKIMNVLGVKTVYNHADFRLMGKVALEALSQYKERNVFLRGIITKIGYKTEIVYYSRKEREAGESKYPLKKMISFAWDGITSFSTKPISLILGIGIFTMFLAFLAFVYMLISYVNDRVVSGWSSILVSIWFLGGLQMFSIGLIGQYIGKTYIESKQRPHYHVEEFLTNETSD